MRKGTKKKIFLHVKRIAIFSLFNASVVLLICKLAGFFTIPGITKGLLYSVGVQVIVALWAFTSGGEMYIGRAGTRYLSTAGYTGQEDKDLIRGIEGEDSKQISIGLDMLVSAAITALIGIL